MARITIDDCTDKIESRFDLVLFASHRARLALEGVSLQADDSHAKKSEKTTVQALREIADGVVVPEEIEEHLISRMQNERNIQKVVEEPVAENHAATGEIEGALVANDDLHTEEEKVANVIKSSASSANSSEAGAISFNDDVFDDDAE